MKGNDTFNQRDNSGFGEQIDKNASRQYFYDTLRANVGETQIIPKKDAFKSEGVKREFENYVTAIDMRLTEDFKQELKRI